MDSIETLKEEIAKLKKIISEQTWHYAQCSNDRDEARQANAGLLEGLRDIRDNPTYGIFYKRFNHVLDLLAQYDTAPKEDKTNEYGLDLREMQK